MTKNNLKTYIAYIAHGFSYFISAATIIVSWLIIKYFEMDNLLTIFPLLIFMLFILITVNLFLFLFVGFFFKKGDTKYIEQAFKSIESAIKKRLPAIQTKELYLKLILKITKGKKEISGTEKQEVVNRLVTHPILSDIKSETRKKSIKYAMFWTAIFLPYFLIKWNISVIETEMLIFFLTGLLIIECRYHLLKFRIESGYYGNNPEEAMEIIKFIRKKKQKDDTYGNNKRYPIFEAEEKATNEQSIKGLVGEVGI